MVCADFADYLRAQAEVDKAYLVSFGLHCFSFILGYFKEYKSIGQPMGE